MEKINIPMAIIIGAIILSIGLGFGLSNSKKGGESLSFADQLEQYQQEQQEAQLEAQRQEQEEAKKLVENVNPISDQDHVRGNPDAPITVYEYSDYECPFCKRFHTTMKEVLEKYPNDVNWVYRHAPLESLHPVKAQREAVAAECAAELGGDDAFWTFSDRFFELTPSNNRTELETVFPQIVKEMGLNQSQFNECLESGRHDDKIASDLENFMETGGRGTPWSILVTESGEKFPINGAQPAAAISQIIEAATN
jgi:protein-disulfide isomerase